MLFQRSKKYCLDMMIEEPKLSTNRHKGVKMETSKWTGVAAPKREKGLVGPCSKCEKREEGQRLMI